MQRALSSKFYRKDLALSEYNFTFNFCRVVIDKFIFKVRFRYRFVKKFTETTVNKLDKISK